MLPNKNVLRVAARYRLYASSVALLLPFAVRAQPPSPRSNSPEVWTPPAGSPTRRAVLDALRASLDIKSLFEVHHLRVSGRWAYLRCNEVVIFDGERQETDLTVAALLERRESPRGPRWTIVELWTLPEQDARPFAEFVRRVRARQLKDKLPAALFPDDY